MSMFNEHQQEYMKELAAMPLELKCSCGWYTIFECGRYCTNPSQRNMLSIKANEAHNSAVRRAMSIADQVVKENYPLSELSMETASNPMRKEARRTAERISKTIERELIRS